mmetsp:Transcript_20197/g.60917  ORF Transcript_20197/g.60917 Transcript_20197/m.60917 type:complete len:282 (-) Transcript_20197:417-1262(-)|eukprot:CAMPEP_0206134456 /NCGR_PEP_ID=MMETSP1473-20131121/18_1 /ASSEMBLY_ACC=CAM_ASM_001109 /TAXON_ID=1461547 /ORGANISM="Stichococcus sp, Strain RCC1054" /LENGTH=281 /DNA_ID=CAMNT_0053526063 /DNA_START=77 /DNA_END=922 /DNA_ORIENTATION=+
MWEQDKNKVCEEVFRDLNTRVNDTKYKLEAEEGQAIAKIADDVKGRFGAWVLGLGGTGYLFARSLTTGPNPMMRRSGRFFCTVGGAYIGTRIAMRGLREKCLGDILDLDSPLGTEAEALLREKAPDSPLLSRRSSPDMGGEPRPTLADAAALQHAVHQAYRDNVSEAAKQQGMHERPRPGRSSPDSAPRRQDQDQPQPPWSDRQPGQQPDALGGFTSDLFGGSPPSSEGGGQPDSWGGQQPERPAGLDTVHRPRRRTHRTFDDIDLGSSDDSGWGGTSGNR